MTSRKPYPIDEKTIVELRAKLAASSPSKIVAGLRLAGLDKIDSMKFLRDFAGISLHDAKNIVHLSPAWADRYDSDEAFHVAAEEAAKIVFSEETTHA
jgi:ribosomal protein L7/L12